MLYLNIKAFLLPAFLLCIWIFIYEEGGGGYPRRVSGRTSLPAPRVSPHLLRLKSRRPPLPRCARCLPGGPLRSPAPPQESVTAGLAAAVAEPSPQGRCKHGLVAPPACAGCSSSRAQSPEELATSRLRNRASS